MIHPSLKLYLRRLTGKKLAGAIAINGKSWYQGPFLINPGNTELTATQNRTAVF